MTTPSASHRTALLGVALTVALSAGACSKPTDKKAQVTSGVVITTVPVTGSTADSPTTGSPSTTATSVGSSTAASTVPPSTSAATAKPRIELRGNDLAVTRIGTPFRDAVAAVSSVLGPPSADPTSESSCVNADVEVDWRGFRLAGAGGKLLGWLNTRTDLKTPSNVTVGVTLAMLRQVYGDRLVIQSLPSDVGPSWGVKGADIAGLLRNDRVALLFNGSCTPP